MVIAPLWLITGHYTGPGGDIAGVLAWFLGAVSAGRTLEITGLGLTPQVTKAAKVTVCGAL